MSSDELEDEERAGWMKLSVQSDGRMKRQIATWALWLNVEMYLLVEGEQGIREGIGGWEGGTAEEEEEEEEYFIPCKSMGLT
jgi:hypothetical protein